MTTIIAPRDDKIYKVGSTNVPFPNIWADSSFNVGTLISANGISFGFEPLNYYRELDATGAWINCTNVNPATVRITRVGRQVNIILKAFNFGTCNGGTLQTLASAPVPIWARPPASTGNSQYGIVAGVSLTSILFIASTDGNLVIQKASGNVFIAPINGDTVNITNDLTLTYVV